jgi:hypothetical protein
VLPIPAIVALSSALVLQPDDSDLRVIVMLARIRRNLWTRLDRSITLNRERSSQGLLLPIEVHELVEQNWFIDEAKRVLASGGIFVGVFQNRHSWRAVLNLRSSVKGAMKHYTAGYSPWRAKLELVGFEVLREEGICWMPFGRMSDSKLIPLAVQLEKTMGLRRLASISPWIVFAAKKV